MARAAKPVEAAHPVVADGPKPFDARAADALCEIAAREFDAIGGIVADLARLVDITAANSPRSDVSLLELRRATGKLGDVAAIACRQLSEQLLLLSNRSPGEVALRAINIYNRLPSEYSYLFANIRSLYDYIEKCISDEEPTDQTTFAARLSWLAEFAQVNPEALVAERMRALFPELSGTQPIESTAADALVPTAEQLEREGNRYSDAYARDPSITIIDHLKSAVWWPTIERGALTRPILLHADKGAYAALTKWLRKDGNVLADALGREIPNKSQVVRASLTPEVIREARRIARLGERDTGRAR